MPYPLGFACDSRTFCTTFRSQPLQSLRICDSLLVICLVFFRLFFLQSVFSKQTTSNSSESHFDVLCLRYIDYEYCAIVSGSLRSVRAASFPFRISRLSIELAVHTLQTVYWIAEVRCALTGRDRSVPQAILQLALIHWTKKPVFCRLQKPTQHTANNSNPTQSKPKNFSSK